MTWVALAKTVRERFADEVATPEALPFQMNNEGFTPPSTGPWASVFITPGESAQVELGEAPTYRTNGAVFMQFYVDIGQGEGRVMELADVATLAFRGKTVDGVVFRAPTARSMGRNDRWWRWDVTVAFYCDETGA